MVSLKQVFLDLCHVPTQKDIYITVDILYAVGINGHIFQLYLHGFISFNDFWNQNNGLYPLIKDFILHCTVLEFDPGISKKLYPKWGLICFEVSKNQ